MDKLFGYPSIKNIRGTTKNDQFSIDNWLDLKNEINLEVHWIGIYK